MPQDFALLVADVYELAGLLRQSGEALAASEGQTQARWQLMSAVSDGGLTVPQAARRLGISRQAVQRVANALVHDGLAAFADNLDHRTSPLLILTDQGNSTLSRISRRATFADAAMSQRVDPAILRAAHEGVRQLIAALSDANQK